MNNLENLLSDRLVAMTFINGKELTYKGYELLTKGAIIGVCEEGALSVKVNGQKINCFRGECIVIPPYHILTDVDCTDDIIFRILCIPEDSISRIPAFDSKIWLQEIPAEPVVRLSPETLYEIRHSMERIQVLSANAGDSLNDHLKTFLAYTVILEALSEFPAEISIRETDRKQMMARQFIKNLLLNFKEHRNVDFYAEKAFVTSKYLSMVVKNVTGATIQEWISRALLQESKRLLRNTDMTVAQVAIELDFSTAASFVRFFKARTGTTPDKWRK